MEGALEQENLIEGEEGPYGLFITAVDGVAANADSWQWRRVAKDGGQLDTGVSETPLADGDRFELALMTGY